MRHGQTHANVSGELDTAHPGLDLTDLGRAQAVAASRAIADEPLDAIYVSSRVRTHQTAAPTAEARGLSPIPLDGLEEIDAGDFEMRADHDAVAGYIGSVATWLEGDLSHRMPGGETGEEFLARYDAAVRTIVDSGHSAALIVIARRRHPDVGLDPDDAPPRRPARDAAAAQHGTDRARRRRRGRAGGWSRGRATRSAAPTWRTRPPRTPRATSTPTTTVSSAERCGASRLWSHRISGDRNGCQPRSRPTTVELGCKDPSRPLGSSAYADAMETSVGTDDGGSVYDELAAVREAKRELTRREEVAVRRARHSGLSWAEIGTLLGVTRQTMHRKYRKVG